MRLNTRLAVTAVQVGFLLTCFAGPVFADDIDFESQCPSGVQASGPCATTFAAVGNAQNVTVSTSIGNVTFTGGAILDETTNLPADETAIYGTAGNAGNIGVSTGTGFTNPLTITFPVAITNFFLDVLNGNVQDVTYMLADNNGNTASFDLIPNLSGGEKTIGFAATGTQVTITATTGQSTPSGLTWDFFIDNVHFDEPLPGSTVPEPATMTLMLSGVAALMSFRRMRKV